MVREVLQMFEHHFATELLRLAEARSGARVCDPQQVGRSYNVKLIASMLLARTLKAPHPCPMASQARHQMDAPNKLFASRNVVPVRRGEGEWFAVGKRSSVRIPFTIWSYSRSSLINS